MKPNIILITIDALRADYAYKNKETHPFLDSLIKKSVVFRRAISPAPSTSQSFRCLFTDLYPNENKRSGISRFHIPKNTKYISYYFRNIGYSTAGFSNNANLTRLQGYDRGFDYFYDGLNRDDTSSNDDKATTNKKNKLKKRFLSFIKKHMDINIKFGKRFFGRIMGMFFYPGYESSQSLFERVKRFVSKQDKEKPMFVWAHMMEAHSPYNLSMDLFDKIGEKRVPDWERQWLRHVKHQNRYVSESGFSEIDMEKIKRMYKCGIRYIDNILKDFFEYLESTGILNNSVIFITSDHGENLGDWDLLSHTYIYNSVLHVPLVVYNGKEMGDIDFVFSNKHLIDLMMCLIDSQDIMECAKIYDKPAISEARKHGKVLYAIQNLNYKIVIDKDRKCIMCYTMKDGKEAKEITVDYNRHTKQLFQILKHHVLSMEDVEKDKIMKAINISKI